MEKTDEETTHGSRVSSGTFENSKCRGSDQKIAHAVLVEGRPQTEFVDMLGLSKAAVSRAVTRVWEQHIPQGYERVKAVLPAHQAFIVKKWAAEAQDKMESEK